MKTGDYFRSLFAFILHNVLLVHTIRREISD